MVNTTAELELQVTKESQFETYEVCALASLIPGVFRAAYIGHIPSEDLLSMIRNRVQLDAAFHRVLDHNFTTDGHVPPGIFHSPGSRVVYIQKKVEGYKLHLQLNINPSGK